MGARARAKRSAWDLPEDQRICIWCDGRAPQCEFRTREHVVAEGLGGDRDYRLKGGLVCDACNRGTLQKIDEEMLLLEPLRTLRALFGLAAKGKDIAQGIAYSHSENEFTVDTTKLRNENTVEFDPVRGVITTHTAGPSTQARSEHLARGLHRIAYNVLAHHHGGVYVRTRFRFLRDLVLDLDAIRERAFVLDQAPILPAMQAEATRRTRKRWYSTAELVNGLDGEPEIVKVSIGPAIFYASVGINTAALARASADRSRDPGCVRVLDHRQDQGGVAPDRHTRAVPMRSTMLDEAHPSFTCQGVGMVERVRTGLVTSGCYAAPLRDCDGGALTREHYISKSILKLMGRTLGISGVSWAPNETKISPKSLSAWILCKRHNGQLSSLDGEAARFFETLDAAGQREQVGTREFDGVSIERWGLKVLAGLLASGSALRTDGINVREANIEEHLVGSAERFLEYLFGYEQLPSDVGFHVMLAPPGTRSGLLDVRLNSIPPNEPEGRLIRAITFQMHGLFMTVSFVSLRGDGVWHRPRAIRLMQFAELATKWDTPSDLVVELADRKLLSPASSPMTT